MTPINRLFSRYFEGTPPDARIEFIISLAKSDTFFEDIDTSFVPKTLELTEYQERLFALFYFLSIFSTEDRIMGDVYGSVPLIPGQVTDFSGKIRQYATEYTVQDAQACIHSNVFREYCYTHTDLQVYVSFLKDLCLCAHDKSVKQYYELEDPGKSILTRYHEFDFELRWEIIKLFKSTKTIDDCEDC